MNLAITGAAGMLGSVLLRRLAPDHDVTAVVHQSPLAHGAAPARVVRWDLTGAPPALHGPVDCWIHCAAFTAVDAAEADPEGVHRVNVEGTRAVLKLAATHGARLIYISTDSVFDGERGLYAEDDAVSPVNQYARSKVAAEELVRAYDRGLIVRTNLVARHGGLVRWIIDTARAGQPLSLFTDVVFNPVPVSEFPPLLLALMEADAAGTVHVGSVEVLSKAQFGRLVIQRLGLDHVLIREVRLRDTKLKAPRPRDTSLCTLQARRQGLKMPSIDSLLERLATSE